MKSLILLLSIAIASICSAAEKLPPGHPPVNTENASANAAQLPQKGKVLDVINVPQYTYLEVSQEDKSTWIAAPTAEVKKGDIVRFEDGLVMKDFHSKVLDRTFSNIVFVNRVVVSEEKE